MTQYSHRGWYSTNLLLCDILWKKGPHTGPCHIWHTVCSLSLAARRTQTAAQSDLLASVCYGDYSCSSCHCRSSSSSPPPSPSSSSSSFPALALRPTIVCLVYTTYDWPELQKHYTSKDTNVFYSGSKTDLKLWCNCVSNSSYLRVPKTFLVDWWLCVACYYPSTSRRRSVGPPVAVNIDICRYLQFFSITSSELYRYNMPMTTFLVKKEFSLHRPVLIFQPTVNSRASNNQSKQCLNRISQLGKKRSY
jgi:hypothetical protein